MEVELTPLTITWFELWDGTIVMSYDDDVTSIIGPNLISQVLASLPSWFCNVHIPDPLTKEVTDRGRREQVHIGVFVHTIVSFQVVTYSRGRVPHSHVGASHQLGSIFYHYASSQMAYSLCFSRGRNWPSIRHTHLRQLKGLDKIVQFIHSVQFEGNHMQFIAGWAATLSPTMVTVLISNSKHTNSDGVIVSFLKMVDSHFPPWSDVDGNGSHGK